jgi:hypothetical protein
MLKCKATSLKLSAKMALSFLLKYLAYEEKVLCPNIDIHCYGKPGLVGQGGRATKKPSVVSPGEIEGECLEPRVESKILPHSPFHPLLACLALQIHGGEWASYQLSRPDR